MPRLIIQFVLLIALSCLHPPAALSADTPAHSPPSPVMTADHRIVAGSKSIWAKPSWPQLNLNIDSDAIGSFYEIFDLGRGGINPVFFMDPRQVHGDRGTTFTAGIRATTASDVKLGDYSLSMTLLENGWIEIKGIARMTDPTQVKDRYAVLDLPSYLTLKGKLAHGDKSTPLDGAVPTTFTDKELADAELLLFPDHPRRSFTIRPVSCSAVIVNGSRLSFRPDGKGVLRLLLDIRTTGGEVSRTGDELSLNGIDFRGIDRLQLPDYRASRNLIQNPSFEEGLRYWGFPLYAGHMIPLKYQGVFALDQEVGHTGPSSLRLKALPVRSPLSLGHIPTPFIPGEPYVYSFYAKASSGHKLRLYVWGRGRHAFLFPDSNTRVFEVTDQWQRFSIPFTANERFSCIYMDALDPDGWADGKESFIWVDDVQLEQAQKPTEFVDLAVASQLTSAARGNFLKFGQEPGFAINVRTLPNTSGSVTLSVEDFFFQTVFRGSYDFNTGADGSARITLNDLSRWLIDNKLRGVFIVKAGFDVKGLKRQVHECYRFSSMNFLDNTQKNKNIFNFTCVYALQAGGPEMERFIQREREIGFGSVVYDFIGLGIDPDYDLDRERMELLKKYGFAHMGRPVVQVHTGEDGEISEEQGKIKMSGIKHMIDPSSAQLKQFEDIVALKAKMRPWNNIWWFTGESNPAVRPMEAHRDAFARFLLATCRGAKRGNPDAKVLIEGGPWTIDPENGGKWVEQYIQDTRRLDPSIRFDGAAGHHYRDFPETPDIDRDIASFLAMLDRNGCKDWPLYLNEGGNYLPFNIPQEGMSPYIQHSGNSWYIGPLSYDFGRAERISAAFSARTWLIGLKYASRVACVNDFNTPARLVDIDLTPRPYDKIVNTLGHVLGNATFYRDLRFAPKVRCYVFTDDATGRPIAAIWGYDEAVDRWKKDPPPYSFDFGRQSIKFLNLMENEAQFAKGADGRIIIPISSFPLFIIGQPGTREALCAAIAGATPTEGIKGNVLDVAAFPENDGHASVIFANPVEREISGEAAVVINGTESKLPLHIPPRGTIRQRLALPRFQTGKLLPFEFSCLVDGQKTNGFSGRYMVIQQSTATPAQGVPAIELGSGLSIAATISGNNLVISLNAAGEKRPPEEVFAGVGFYAQPVMNPYGWAKPKTARQDLAVYELVRSDSGKLAAMCRYVQGTQAGSGSYLVAGEIQQRIEVKTGRSPEGVWVVLTVPQEVLAPLVIKPASRFGLNVSVPSHSDKVKSLAPIEGFKSVAEPGELNLVMAIVGE
jgi:hypothetical protein